MVERTGEEGAGMEEKGVRVREKREKCSESPEVTTLHVLLVSKPQLLNPHDLYEFSYFRRLPSAQ